MLRMLHLCTSIVVLCSPLAGQRIQTMMIPAGIVDVMIFLKQSFQKRNLSFWLDEMTEIYK
jgi:hypothetical protein